MRPVLEQPPLTAGAAPTLAVAVEREPVEALARVWAKPRERRQVVGAGEDVDRVELQQADVVEHSAQVAAVDPPRRSPPGEPLRRQRGRSRLFSAQFDLRAPGHAQDFHFSARSGRIAWPPPRGT